MNQKTTIDVSSLTILKVFGLGILLWFLWYIREIVLLLFVVLILVSVFSPWVEKLQKKKIPRLLSVILIFICIFAVFSFLIYLVVPPLVFQIKELVQNIPYYLQRVSPIYQQTQGYLPSLQKSLEGLASFLNKLTLNVWSAALTIFGGALSFLTVLVLTFYLLLEKESALGFLMTLLPIQKRGQILNIYKKTEVKIGFWLGGQLLLCLLIGLLDFIVLIILGVPYALVLGILSGALEIIPVIGPILSAVPAIILGFSVSPWTAFFVLLAYFGIQQMESQILVPKIMGKIIGVSPVVIIITLAIGAKLFGVLGAILAVPFSAIVQVVFTEWRMRG